MNIMTIISIRFLSVLYLCVCMHMFVERPHSAAWQPEENVICWKGSCFFFLYLEKHLIHWWIAYRANIFQMRKWEAKCPNGKLKSSQQKSLQQGTMVTQWPAWSAGTAWLSLRLVSSLSSGRAGSASCAVFVGCRWLATSLAGHGWSYTFIPIWQLTRLSWLEY